MHQLNQIKATIMQLNDSNHWINQFNHNKWWIQMNKLAINDDNSWLSWSNCRTMDLPDDERAECEWLCLSAI